MFEKIDSYLNFCDIFTKDNILWDIKEKVKSNNNIFFDFHEICKDRENESILTLIEIDFGNNVEYLIINNDLKINPNRASWHYTSYTSEEDLLSSLESLIDESMLLRDAEFYICVAEELKKNKVRKKIRNFK